MERGSERFPLSLLQHFLNSLRCHNTWNNFQGVFCSREVLVRWLHWHKCFWCHSDEGDSQSPWILMEEVKRKGWALWSKRRSSSSRLRGIKKKNLFSLQVGTHSFKVLEGDNSINHKAHSVPTWTNPALAFYYTSSKDPLLVPKHPLLLHHIKHFPHKISIK